MSMKGTHTNNMGEMHLLTKADNHKPQEMSSKRIRLSHESVVGMPQGSWEAFTELPPNSTGYVIRILDVPNFIDFYEEHLSGVIFYNTKDDNSTAIYQANIPVFRLNAKDFARGKYRPFTAGLESPGKQQAPEHTLQKQNPDILSIILSSEHVLLSVRAARVNESPSLVQALTEGLKFEAPCSLSSRTLLFNRGGGGEKPELSGILLILNASKIGVAEQTLDVYARNDSQIYLLVHCLYAVLPTNAVIFVPNLSKPSAKKILLSLKSEQELVWSHLRSSSGSFQPVDKLSQRERTSKFRETLSEIECRTDQLLMGQVTSKVQGIMKFVS